MQRTLSLAGLVVLVLGGLIALGTTASQRPLAVAAKSAPAAGRALPAHVFAPYVDTSAGISLTQTARNSGTMFYTLGFVLNGHGSCVAEWNGDGTTVTSGFYQSDIASLRAMGGDAIPSFGGAAGVELGQACQDVRSLQAQYQSVIDNYHFTAIDFDIEGAAVADPPSIDRRNKAIAGLQRQQSLTVSYTLPVLPSGLTQDGLNLLQNAVSNGVHVNVVNIMTMDYGGNPEMGQAAVAAANSLFNQLKSIFPGRSDAQIWATEGNTPMIGVNDVQPEVFTLSDAQTLASFAKRVGINRVAFWSVNRDQACPGGPGGSASDSCSGVNQSPHQFAGIFNSFSGGGPPPPSPTPRPTPTGTPSPTPRPSPTATPPPPPPGGNLVSNPGFESGLAGWSCSSADTAVGSPVHSGSGALAARATDSDNAQCTQTIRVQPNTDYTLSAWVQGNYAFIGVLNGASNFVPSASSFTQLQVSFNSGGASSVTIFVHGWYAQGTVFADDFHVS